MVLKKSNTRLNSGATQRAANHAGLLQVEDLQNEWAQNVQNKVTVTFKQLKKDLASREESSSYLSLIEEYLDCHLFTPSVHNLGSWGTTYDYSLRKQDRRFLPEKIKTMMKDSEFLENHIPCSNLTFKEVQDRPGCGRNRYKECISIKSTDLQKSNDEQTHQVPKSRRRITYHGRGVQRPHQFNAKVDQDNKNDPERERRDPLCELSFLVSGPFHLDTRSATKKRLEKKWSHFMRFAPHKASMKLKGCVNGLQCHRKGYTKIGMKEDIYNALNDPYFDDIDNDSDESEVLADTSHRNGSISYDITEFLTQPRPCKDKKKKKICQVSQDDTLPYDSTDHPFRYSKGSYIIMPGDDLRQDQSLADWEVINKEDVLMDKSDFDVDSMPVISKVHAADVHDVRTLPFPDMEEDSDMFKDETLHAFDESFHEINVLMAKEQAAWFSSQNNVLLPNSKRPMGNYDVIIGQSLPFCFTIDVSRVELLHQQPEHKRYLVARKSPMGGMLWSVSVQDQRLSHDQCKVLLQQAMEYHYPQGISLPQLVDLVASLDQQSDVPDTIIANNPDVLSEKKNCGYHVEEVTARYSMSSLIPQSVDILSPDDAFELLQSTHEKTQEKNVMDSSETARVMNISDWSEVNEKIDEVTECDICCRSFTTTDTSSSAVTLLPCMHTYCVQCWGTFVGNSMRAVVPRITCMHSKCSSAIDEATVMTLMPYSVIMKWQQQLRNRYIDLSLFCRWCPHMTCHKVAVSITEMMKQKFGKPVLCDCMHIWCGNCQKAPHWPAACDQMDMLRGFIAKVESTLGHTAEQTNFFVEVKKCPSCHYPIEKNGGCSYMQCGMCHTSFCWTCNRSFFDHHLYDCKLLNKDLVTYNLQNRLEVSIGPLKHYISITECREISNKLKKVKVWFDGLNHVYEGRTTVFPHHVRFRHHYNINTEVVAGLGVQCFCFLQQIFEVLECFFLLLCFVSAKKNKNESQKNLEKFTSNTLSQLLFIAKRLEKRVLKKSLLQIHRSQKQIRFLMGAGWNLISKLVSLAPALQKLSKDVEIPSIEELDPTKYLRYK